MVTGLLTILMIVGPEEQPVTHKVPASGFTDRGARTWMASSRRCR
ncbi:MAG: hypothetical protein AVDCRST_MAG19-1027 [uncultured Thermomicrobiales bacterium]|uniref:Uncharacterized protein n=1 Tax=uncultured Thermomicrobiales bacterium TaxID=1645740 RepID=A0A6J4UMS3_9BACT|nr:MAG: hypothetical protein AVDCRST_MAG19-1027 [uncultured Thermomicrobiales bacterium]